MRARVYVYVHAREVARVSVRVCAWYTVFIYCFLMPSFVVVLFYFLKQFFNIFLLSLSLFFLIDHFSLISTSVLYNRTYYFFLLLYVFTLIAAVDS